MQGRDVIQYTKEKPKSHTLLFQKLIQIVSKKHYSMGF